MTAYVVHRMIDDGLGEVDVIELFCAMTSAEEDEKVRIIVHLPGKKTADVQFEKSALERVYLPTRLSGAEPHRMKFAFWPGTHTVAGVVGHENGNQLTVLPVM